MTELVFEDVILEYAIRGKGGPVVLIHASPFVEWYDPLVEHLPDFSALTYRRRLRPDAAGGYRPLTAAEDAAICRRLMTHVGWQAAHVVGHSYGALVALALALEAPEQVHSLALLEPAARGIASSEQAVAALQPASAAYRAGDKAKAVDAFLRAVCGDGYRPALDRTVPGGFDTSVAQADLFFQAEMPAVQQFRFTADDARRISQPVLNMGGAVSAARFVQVGELVQTWFPHAERVSVPAAGHLLMVANPSSVAQALREFFGRHPLADVGGAVVDP